MLPCGHLNCRLYTKMLQFEIHNDNLKKSYSSYCIQLQRGRSFFFWAPKNQEQKCCFTTISGILVQATVNFVSVVAHSSSTSRTPENQEQKCRFSIVFINKIIQVPWCLSAQLLHCVFREHCLKLRSENLVLLPQNVINLSKLSSALGTEMQFSDLWL